MIYKQNGTAELILMNKTKDSTGGILTNIGNGRTAFIKTKVIDDTLLVIGGDTVVIAPGGGEIPSLDNISDLIDYEGDKSSVLVKDSAKGGLFIYDTSGTTDGGTVYPATGIGSGVWRRFVDYAPSAKWWAIDNNADTVLSVFDGNIARKRDLDAIKYKLSSGKGLRWVTLGNSISAGIGISGSGPFGEANGLQYPSAQNLLAVLLMQHDPGFVPLDPTVYHVYPPQDSTGGMLFQGMPLAAHRLTYLEAPTLTYTIAQEGARLTDSITVYYLERTASTAALFDITINGSAHTVDTYVPQVSYLLSGSPQDYDVQYRLAKKTFFAGARKTNTVVIDNIAVANRGSGTPSDGTAVILGFAFGSGLEYKNFAVSSTTLLNNSAANAGRGITTDERLDSAFKYSPDVIMMGWGTNDSKAGISSPAAFKADYIKRVDQIRANNPSAVIILFAAPRGLGGDYTDNIIYNRVMREVAIEKNLSLFDCQQLADNVPGLLADNVHPSKSGYVIIANAMADMLGVANFKVTKGDEDGWSLQEVMNIGSSTSIQMNLSGGIASVVSGNDNIMERTSTGTNTRLTAIMLKHTTTGNMANGFGAVILFSNKDDSGVDNNIGDVGFVRAGADNSGAFVVRPYAAGNMNNERFRVDHSGTVTMSGLAGSGNRMVITNNSGELSHRAIPDSSTYATLYRLDTAKANIRSEIANIPDSAYYVTNTGIDSIKNNIRQELKDSIEKFSGGQFTPSGTSIANVELFDNIIATYTRTNNVVTVFITLDVTVDDVTAVTSFTLPPPIPIDFVGVNELAGQNVNIYGVNLDGTATPPFAESYPSTDEIKVEFTTMAGSADVARVSLSFSYIITP